MSVCNRCQRDPDEYDRALRRLADERDGLRVELDEKNVKLREYDQQERELRARIRELELQVAGAVEGVPNGSLLGGPDGGGAA